MIDIIESPLSQTYNWLIAVYHVKYISNTYFFIITFNDTNTRMYSTYIRIVVRYVKIKKSYVFTTHMYTYQNKIDN